MDKYTIEKLEEYRGRLKELQTFEERLSSRNCRRLEVQTWSPYISTCVSSTMFIDKEPEIKEAILVSIRNRIKYYEDKIKEL